MHGLQAVERVRQPDQGLRRSAHARQLLSKRMARTRQEALHAWSGTHGSWLVCRSGPAGC